MKEYSVPFIDKKIENAQEKLIRVCVPGSKSITNRALLLATLGQGPSLLKGSLFSEDSRYFLSCIQELGITTQVNEALREIRVEGQGGEIPQKEATLYVGSAGTAARFLTALLGLTKGTYHMNSSLQMKKRPMDSLLSSLEELGAKVSYQEEIGHFPFTITGPDCINHAKEVLVNVEKSSQFLSALLIAACTTNEVMTIRVEGEHGMAYVDMTIKMMEQFGVLVEQPEQKTFRIPSGQHFTGQEYRIEPDVSAACYFYALAPLLGIKVLVPNVHSNSLQGDVEFLNLLVKMGCSMEETEEGIVLLPPPDNQFKGIDADMHSCSDQAITLAAVSIFAKGATTIKGIGHIRYQESNRIQAMVTELTKIGIECVEHEDGLTIYPGKPQPGRIVTYDDHRMAMGFSLIGLRAPGIVIDDPLCCRKTFENYFEVLEEVIGKELK